ncbi:hypothetical protein HanXRQr2_Chr09g0396571 [Helianthus annuus]|uniref:Uncharacterized protein n=1 Tax=Helianthus annuus TaxID=4232 RepID=A0A251T4I2_HELAN|nr:hypothetical protein HanXRQr2_Chr09g0396571 [Helianthus annuus]KAJ0893841.1 hypothetical protein HanPSC8_Chr09g0382341 [Helianthus annuus]
MMYIGIDCLWSTQETLLRREDKMTKEKGFDYPTFKFLSSNIQPSQKSFPNLILH